MKLKSISSVSRKIEIDNQYVEVHPGELVEVPADQKYDKDIFVVDTSKKKTVQQKQKEVADKALKEKIRMDKINKTGIYSPPEELVEKEVKK